MKIGTKGIELIKHFEGFRSQPYYDPVNVATIGYGATHYGNGVNVKISDNSISEKEASILLINMLVQYENAVDQVLNRTISQNQYDALVSFTYNLGGGALAQSTLLKKVNINPADPSIKNEFMRWIYAGGVPLNGLIRRRAAESELYFR